MTHTGKRARQKYGNRYAAKRAKVRRPKRKHFGELPISTKRGNAQAFVLRGER
jgi:hypothetical protein